MGGGAYTYMLVDRSGRGSLIFLLHFQSSFFDRLLLSDIFGSSRTLFLALAFLLTLLVGLLSLQLFLTPGFFLLGCSLALDVMPLIKLTLGLSFILYFVREILTKTANCKVLPAPFCAQQPSTPWA